MSLKFYEVFYAKNRKILNFFYLTITLFRAYYASKRGGDIVFLTGNNNALNVVVILLCHNSDNSKKVVCYEIFIKI